MSSTHPSTLVFIDSTVDNYQLLEKGVISNANVIVLDANQDGIAQITEALEGNSGIHSIHIVSHGDPGQVYLGTTRLNLQALDHYTQQIQSWAQSLTNQAEILLYGCRVGMGDMGAAFIQRLGALTRATIAASTTLTGHQTLGGDWILEKQTGPIRSPLAFDQSTLSAYPSTLADAFPNLLYATANNTNSIFTVDPTTGALTQVGTLLFPSVALARDAITGRLYYVEDVVGAADVAYWDPATGQNQLVGTSNFNRLVKLAQAQDGSLYGLDQTTENLYRLDLASGATTFVNLTQLAGLVGIGDAPGSAVPFTAGTGDIAFDPNDSNRLMVLVSGAGTGLNRLFSVDINPTSPTYLQSTFIGNTGMPDTGVGSLAFGADGFLYATAGGSLYRIDPTTGVAQIPPIGQTTLNGTPISSGDFATLPIATPAVDIQVTKGDGLTSITPGATITYTITVTNLDPLLDLNGISLVDPIPTDILNPTWSVTFETPGGVVISDPADRSGAGNIDVSFDLNAQASVTYTVTGTVSATVAIGSTLSNTATVIVPTGITDPNLNNNVSTDTTIISTTTAGNQPPTVTNSSVGGITPGSVVPVTGLTGNDPDGTVSSYTITTLPPTTQGTLFLGNPGTGGTPVTQGQVLTPTQISQLFFQSNPGFTTAIFTYSATDNQGSPSLVPGTVNLTSTTDGGGGGGSNQPPTVTPVTITGGPNTVIPVTGLTGVDPDGTVTSYTITTIPDPEQGILYLGNPNNGGTPVQSGQVLTPTQISQLFFLTTDDFTDTSFSYIATDNQGLSGPPASVEMTVVDGPTVGCEVGVNRKGNGGKNKLKGTPGTDSLTGLAGNDVLRGLPCDDLIESGTGNDKAFGGRDRDTLLGNQNNDTLKGGPGRDILRGGLGLDILRGNDGVDYLRAGRGKDRLFGGRNRDIIEGNLGDDRIGGNGGADVINAGGGSDLVKGGPKGDRIAGRGKKDTIGGGRGDDFIRANAGADDVQGGSGNDIIYGGIGADVIKGNAGNDFLEGGRGDDTLRGRGGDDLLIGMENRDFLGGGGGDDDLFGRGGRDTLAGRKGNDVLVGGRRRDRLNGGAGGDIVNGGRGGDTMLGGKGADTFVMTRVEDKGDVILDFSVDQDVIDLTRIFNSPEYSAPNAFDQYVRLRSVGADTIVQIDANGSAAGRQFTTVLLIQNIAPNSLSASNFLV